MNGSDKSYWLLLFTMASCTGCGISLGISGVTLSSLIFGLAAVVLGTVVATRCLKPLKTSNSDSSALLTELASHLSKSAEVNRSVYTDKPYGVLQLETDSGSLWSRVLAATDQTVELGSKS